MAGINPAVPPSCRSVSADLVQATVGYNILNTWKIYI